MDIKDFELIEPLKEKPILPQPERRLHVEKAILEFANSEYKYAAVKNELTKEYKNISGCARAIGRVISSLKKKGVITVRIRVYSTLDKIYLEKI